MIIKLIIMLLIISIIVVLLWQLQKFYCGTFPYATNSSSIR